MLNIPESCRTGYSIGMLYRRASVNYAPFTQKSTQLTHIVGQICGPDCWLFQVERSFRVAIQLSSNLAISGFEPVLPFYLAVSLGLSAGFPHHSAYFAGGWDSASLSILFGVRHRRPSLTIIIGITGGINLSSGIYRLSASSSWRLRSTPQR